MGDVENKNWQVYSELAGNVLSGPMHFRVTLADCTEEHALSVMEALVYDRACPDDLFLVEVKSVADPEPIGKPIPYTPKEKTVG